MLMHKKKILLWILFSSIVLISGCETAKGAAEGLVCGVGSTAAGVAKDTRNTYNFIMTVDNWMKENLW